MCPSQKYMLTAINSFITIVQMGEGLRGAEELEDTWRRSKELILKPLIREEYMASIEHHKMQEADLHDSIRYEVDVSHVIFSMSF